jgi:hypothetical protein
MPSDFAASNSGRVAGLGLVVHPPARKESGQREFGKDDDIAAACFRLAHHFEQARDDPLARLVAGDGAQLTPGDGEKTFHEIPPPSAKRGKTPVGIQSSGSASALSHRYFAPRRALA